MLKNKKILIYFLVIFSAILIFIPISIKKKAADEKENIKNNLETQLIEFCNYAFIDLDEDTGEVWINIQEMKSLFGYDISVFENKKYDCDLNETHIEVKLEGKELVCKPVLSCKYFNNN